VLSSSVQRLEPLRFLLLLELRTISSTNNGIPSRFPVESSPSGETSRTARDVRETVLIEEIAEIATKSWPRTPTHKKRGSETINITFADQSRMSILAFGRLEANSSNNIYDRRSPRPGRRHRGLTFLVTM